MLDWSIEIDTDDLEARLARYVAGVSDLTKAWDEVGSSLKAESDYQFEMESGLDGAKWPALAESTLKRKPRRRGGQILQDTRRLLNSVVWIAKKDGLSFGSKLPHALIHQMGGKAGRGKSVNIPARPYMPFTPDLRLPGEVLAEAEQILLKHMRKSMTS